MCCCCLLPKKTKKEREEEGKKEAEQIQKELTNSTLNGWMREILISMSITCRKREGREKEREGGTGPRILFRLSDHTWAPLQSEIDLQEEKEMRMRNEQEQAREDARERGWKRKDTGTKRESLPSVQRNN